MAGLKKQLLLPTKVMLTLSKPSRAGETNVWEGERARKWMMRF